MHELVRAACVAALAFAAGCTRAEAEVAKPASPALTRRLVDENARALEAVDRALASASATRASPAAASAARASPAAGGASSASRGPARSPNKPPEGARRCSPGEAGDPLADCLP